MSETDPTDSLPDDLPPRLAADLASLFPPPKVSPAIDQRILNTARAALANRRRRTLRWPGVAAAVAAIAAGVLIAIRLVPYQHAGPSVAQAPVTTQPSLPGDVNGDGRVDILDAFVVARALADKSRTTPLPAAWDVNHDGVIDQKDVDWIANAAVRVSGTVSATARGSDDVVQLATQLRALRPRAQQAVVAQIERAADGAMAQ